MTTRRRVWFVVGILPITFDAFKRRTTLAETYCTAYRNLTWRKTGWLSKYPLHQLYTHFSVPLSSAVRQCERTFRLFHISDITSFNINPLFIGTSPNPNAKVTLNSFFSNLFFLLSYPLSLRNKKRLGCFKNHALISFSLFRGYTLYISRR